MADNHVVMAFFRGLLRERKGIFFWLIVLNALAAATALVIPRLLGNLVDRLVEGGAQAAQLGSLNHLAWVIVAVVCTQAVLTFLAQGTSTIFRSGPAGVCARVHHRADRAAGSSPLSGRVEGASTGDLVTRVTRDVGTMSRSVQFGVPQAIISGLDRRGSRSSPCCSTRCCSRCRRCS